MVNSELSHQEDECWHWCVGVDVDECQGLGQVPLPGPHEEEAGGHEDAPVEGPEGGARHEEGHQPGHVPQHPIPETLQTEQEN